MISGLFFVGIGAHEYDDVVFAPAKVIFLGQVNFYLPIASVDLWPEFFAESP